MKHSFTLKSFTLVFLLIITIRNSFAQTTINGMVRTRTEYRNGQGTLPEVGRTPSVFTSQRTRLNFGHNTDRFRLFTTIQDVRVWGQDGSTISNADGNKLFLHEAWGEIIFNDTVRLKNIKNLSLKIGRQEIAYDDEKLLGALGWLQQGRRHDAAVLKFAHKTWIVDIGAAFNQDREKKNAGNLYQGIPLAQLGSDSVNYAAAAGSNAIGRMYKTMNYLYLAKEFGFTKVTYLFFRDGFQKHGSATIGSLKKGENERYTTGLSVYGTLMRKHKIDAQAFYQGHQDKDGNTMDAWMFSLNTQFGIGRKFTTGPGYDYLSGNNTTKTTTVNNRFDPLYGTPHKFWGYMDYFYVADPYGLNGNPVLSPGLQNLYLKSKYRLRDNLVLNIDAHGFWAANKVANLATVADKNDGLNKYLGTEIDLVVNFNLSKAVLVEGGYSVMMGTHTLDQLKRPGRPSAPAAVNQRNNGDWAYLMITIRPDFLGGINTAIADLTKSAKTMQTDINTIKETLNK
jgi:hypothetical protein